MRVIQIGFCGVAFLFSCSIFAASPYDYSLTTEVTNVTDGDTFTIEINGEKEKVRILGIDAPEIRSGTQSTCGGEDAKKFLSLLILQKKVTLVRDTITENRDSFGRLLRTVKLGNRLDISVLLLITGKVSVYQKEEFTKKTFYLRLESFAKRKEKGIWGEMCVAEWISKEDAGETSSLKNDDHDLEAGEEEKQVDEECGKKKYCSQMASCSEAKFYLRSCAITSLDKDKDGIPCESLCAP